MGGSPAPAPAAAAPSGPTSTGSYQSISSGAYGLSKEFAADNPTRLPSPTDSALLAAARMRRELAAKSGRSSTALAGTGVYGSSFLGSV